MQQATEIRGLPLSHDESQQKPEAPGRLTWQAAVGIALYGACLLLPGLGSSRALTHHEILFCQTAREMVATGDWVVPRIAGVPSVHYPPGTHWAVASAIFLTGRLDEAVLRLPSVLAAIASAWIVAGLAARWFGRVVALVTGLVHLSMYYVLLQARLAESDMLLAAAVSSAMACFMLGAVESPQGRVSARWLAWLFYTAAAAAALIKALLGLAFIFGACGMWILLRRDWRALRFLLSPLGLLIFFGLTAAWMASALSEYPPYLEWQIYQHFGRFQGECGRQNDHLLFYIYTLPLMTLPWTPLVAWTLFRVVRRGQWRQPWWQFTICWIVPGLILLTLSAFKAKHYLISLLPPLSVPAAMGLLDWVQRPLLGRRTYRVPRAVLVAAGFSAAVLAVEWLQPQGAHAIALVAGGVGAGLLALTLLEPRLGMRGRLGATLGLAGVASVGALCLVMPHHDSFGPQAAFSRRTELRVPDGTPIYLVELPESPVVFYLPRPAIRVDQVDRLAESLPERRSFYLIACEHHSPALAALGTLEVLDGCSRSRDRPEEPSRLALFKLTVQQGSERIAAGEGAGLRR